MRGALGAARAHGVQVSDQVSGPVSDQVDAPASEPVTEPVVVGTAGVTRRDVAAVARGHAPVQLTERALEAMTVARAHVDRLATRPEPAYGVTTGFGALATRHIPAELRERLQLSLIRSHAAGVGEEVEEEVVRALMFLRLKTLASGCTGARPVVATTMAEMLNARITPVVLEHGSLGCSGDLAPLAHCALVLVGEGEARAAGGVRVPGAVAMRSAGIAPVVLAPKEGLALVNGTDGMLGMLVLALADLERLATTGDVTASMSVEALLGTDQVFRPELHMALRPHPGQAKSAANMFAVLEGSEIVASHRHGDTRVQDAYSCRCAPQVAGALRDTLEHAGTVADRELAARIDNPVVLKSGEVCSNGNFHGAPLAYVLDFLAIAACDLASMAERRTDRLLDPARSNGLPAFLAEDPGVDSGLMLAHYAQAALVSEMKRLAVPASVDSIPTSAMQEDHVSMGWAAARKLRRAVDALTSVLSIELVAAARALELRVPLDPAPATASVVRALREVVAGVGPDRFVSPELDAAAGLVRSGAVVKAAASRAGPLS